MRVPHVPPRYRPPEIPQVRMPTNPRNQQAVSLLFLTTIPLGYSMLQDPTWRDLLLCSGLLGLYGASLYAISMGLKDAERYDAQDVARAAPIKGRIVGSAGLGLASGLTALTRGADIGLILAVAVVAAALSLIAFGIDPLKHKGLETAQARMDHKVSKTRIRVEAQMKRIKGHVAPLACPDIMPHLTRFESAVARMVQAVEDDPERARSQQKHLGVYLDGAEEASDRFIAVHRGTGDPETHSRYVQLLHDLGRAYEKRAFEYAEQGRMRLDAQMDVLSENLAQELSRN